MISYEAFSWRLWCDLFIVSELQNNYNTNGLN